MEIHLFQYRNTLIHLQMVEFPYCYVSLPECSACSALFGLVIHHDHPCWIYFWTTQVASTSRHLPTGHGSVASSWSWDWSVGGSGSPEDDCIYLRHLKSQNTWLTDPKKVAYSKGPIWTNTLGRLANVPFQFMYMNGWFLFSGGGNSKIFLFSPRCLGK